MDYILGDVDGNGVVNSGDVIYILNYCFIDGSPPDPIWAGDANCDGVVDHADAIYVVQWLFAGGSDMPSPCFHSHVHQNLLAAYLAYNWKDILTGYLNSTFPSTCTYNIYVSNGTKTILWYDGDVGGGGNIVRAHRVVRIDPSWVLGLGELGGYQDRQIIPGYNGSLYLFTLELEYI